MLTVEDIKQEIMRRREALRVQAENLNSDSFERSQLLAEGNALGELILWIMAKNDRSGAFSPEGLRP